MDLKWFVWEFLCFRSVDTVPLFFFLFISLFFAFNLLAPFWILNSIVSIDNIRIFESFVKFRFCFYPIRLTNTAMFVYTTDTIRCDTKRYETILTDLWNGLTFNVLIMSISKEDALTQIKIEREKGREGGSNREDYYYNIWVCWEVLENLVVDLSVRVNK